MNKSETIGKLAEALSIAQGKYKPIVKNCVNPFFKSKYADLSSIIEATKEALTINNLAVVQTNEVSDNGKLIVTTVLMHSSGEWISGSLSMKPVKDDPQGAGSCLTYMRRYSLQQILMVSAEDEDDGNAASQAKEHLTVEQLVDKMESSQTIFELEARTKKYKPDYDLLTPENQVKVRMAKDKRKVMLKEGEKKDVSN